MNKTILATLLVGLICLSSFNKAPVNYEQIAFDYFVSNVLLNDFKDISVIEFRGQTESTFSTLTDYKFCLKPEEKLKSLIENVTAGVSTTSKKINGEKASNVSIANYNASSNDPKLLIYNTVRVADNFYVFLSIQQLNEPAHRYVFELNVDGKIQRSCAMK